MRNPRCDQIEEISNVLREVRSAMFIDEVVLDDKWLKRDKFF